MSRSISDNRMPESALPLFDDIHIILAPAAKRLLACLTAEGILEETLQEYRAMTGREADLQTGAQLFGEVA